MSLRITTKQISDLIFDPANARSHSEQNLKAIKRSLETFGQRKPIVLNSKDVVVAGNGTLQAAKDLGWTEIETVSVPEDWSDDQIKAFAIADNRTAELAEWNAEQLSLTLANLEESGWELKDLGFTKSELTDITSDLPGSSVELNDDIYTTAVNIPQYDIVGDKPDLEELADKSKAVALRDRISKTDIPSEIKEFLYLAANRHIAFNYAKIAEYYAHATAEIQELMEESALVIIDLDDAIRLGYAQFLDSVNTLESQDRNA